MNEKTPNKIIISPIIKAVLLTLSLVAIMQTITSGVFIYKLNAGKFPDKEEVQNDHKRLQNTADSILKKLDKPN